MSGAYVVEVFVKVVDKLMAEDAAANRKLYVETNDGHYVNFRVDDFKMTLKDAIKSEPAKVYLDIFKMLNWLICQKTRYTNVQKIDGKSVRVITVDEEKYKLLKKLEW